MKTTDELPERDRKEEGNPETKEVSDDCLTSCLSSTAKKESEEEKEGEEEELDTRKAKLLIILGLSLTIPLVIIEIFNDYGSRIYQFECHL